MYSDSAMAWSLPADSMNAGHAIGQTGTSEFPKAERTDYRSPPLPEAHGRIGANDRSARRKLRHAVDPLFGCGRN